MQKPDESHTSVLPPEQTPDPWPGKWKLLVHEPQLEVLTPLRDEARYEAQPGADDAVTWPPALVVAPACRAAAQKAESDV